MSTDLEKRIRERAYALWQQEGHAEGRELEYWSRAERELMSMQDALEEAVDTSARETRESEPKKRRAPTSGSKRTRSKAQPLHA